MFVQSVVSQWGYAVETATASSWSGGGGASAIGAVLGFAGAGVYEEMLFRMLLLPPVGFCAARLGIERGIGVVLAVAVSSVIFAAAHYLGPHGETFNGFSFWFRFTAGAVFAVLFVYRGFGIAAGTHALYDVFVSVG
jgi:membrane protease YdiL (CAAX protease family)